VLPEDLLADNGAGMTARTLKATGERKGNDKGLRGFPLHAARHGILGNIITRKRPPPHSTGEGQRLPIPRSVVESPKELMVVVGERPST